MTDPRDLERAREAVPCWCGDADRHTSCPRCDLGIPEEMAEIMGRIRRDAAMLPGAPHAGPEDCPAWHDRCNCDVETLEHNMARADAAEERAREREQQAERLQIHLFRMVEHMAHHGRACRCSWMLEAVAASEAPVGGVEEPARLAEDGPGGDGVRGRELLVMWGERGGHLLALWDEKDRLTKMNARHKRGFRIGDRPAADTLLHLIEELTEVGLADSHAHRVQEFGDVLGLLFCLAEKLGVDVDAASRSALAKLKEDFPGA